MIIIDLGIILFLFVILFFGGIFAGSVVLERVITFLFGPLKIGAIILVILTIVQSVSFSMDKELRSKLPSKVVGLVFNVFGGVLRNLINVIFFLCVMLGFLQNMEIGGLHILWAVFAIFSDGLVFLILYGCSIYINYFLSILAERIPMFVVGIINAIISVVYFMIAQILVIEFYETTVLELFANQAWIRDFVLNSWLLRLVDIL